MGCDYNLSCRTCKKWHYLGYGSYGTWIDANTVAEYDAKAAADPKAAQLLKNQNLRTALAEHEGHDFIVWSNDFCYHDQTGALCAEAGWTRVEVLIPDHKNFEYVNMDLGK